MDRSLLLNVGLLLLAGTSCAKVGDPLPPVLRAPGTIRDLQLIDQGNLVQMVFSLPPGRLEWVEFYRQCNPQVPQARFNLVARIGLDELTEAGEAGKFVYELHRPNRPATCRYALRFVDPTGQKSDYSNLAPP